MPRTISGRTAKAQADTSRKKRARSTSPVDSSGSMSPSVPAEQSFESANQQQSKRTRSISGDAAAGVLTQDNTSSTSNSQLNTVVVPTIQRGVPAFLNKLFNMVNDPTTNDLIRWSPDGNSFIVEKHEYFAKTVLPRFYKHNTFASFVRQLNMYDFHKVPCLQQGSMAAENEREIWEFSHPNFKRGRADLLSLVTRKRNKDRDAVDLDSVTLGSLVKDIAAIRKHQMAITNDLRLLQKDNAILWQESLGAREKHQRHQEVIQKILQFLTAVFSGSNAIPASNEQMNGPFMLGKNNEYISLLGANGETSGTGQPASGALPETKLPTALIEEAASMVGLNSNAGRPTADNGMGTYAYRGSSLSDILSAAIEMSYSTMITRPHRRVRTGQPQNMPEMPADAVPSETADIESFTQTLNTAARSAEAISQDIDELQVDIENLAANIGIDPSLLTDLSFGDGNEIGEFTGDYQALIEGATRKEKIDLFELAGGSHVRNRYDSSSGSETEKGKSPSVPRPPQVTAAPINAQPVAEAPYSHSHMQPNPPPGVAPSSNGDVNSGGVSGLFPSLYQSFLANSMQIMNNADSRFAHHYRHFLGAQKDDPSAATSSTIPVTGGPAAGGFNAPFTGSAFDPRLYQSLYEASASGAPQRFVPVPVPVPVPIPVESSASSTPSTTTPIAATPTPGSAAAGPMPPPQQQQQFYHQGLGYYQGNNVLMHPPNGGNNDRTPDNAP